MRLPTARPDLFRRTAVSAWRLGVAERAAALTYYTALTVFPTLLLTVCLLDATGIQDTTQFVDAVSTLAPDSFRPLLRRGLAEMAEQETTVWLPAALGGAAALWSATCYLAVFRRVLHTMHRTPDIRPTRRALPRLVLTALALITLLAGGATVLLLSEDVVAALGRAWDVRSATLTVWQLLRWPLLVATGALLALLLLRAGPAGSRAFALIAPGGAVAAVLWVGASAGFSGYTELTAGSYTRLYGPLAGAIVFLVWLWLSNLALLLGAQFNAELAGDGNAPPPPGD